MVALISVQLTLFIQRREARKQQQALWKELLMELEYNRECIQRAEDNAAPSQPSYGAGYVVDAAYSKALQFGILEKLPADGFFAVGQAYGAIRRILAHQAIGHHIRTDKRSDGKATVDSFDGGSGQALFNSAVLRGQLMTASESIREWKQLDRVR